MAAHYFHVLFVQFLVDRTIRTIGTLLRLSDVVLCDVMYCG